MKYTRRQCLRGYCWCLEVVGCYKQVTYNMNHSFPTSEQTDSRQGPARESSIQPVCHTMELMELCCWVSAHWAPSFLFSPVFLCCLLSPHQSDSFVIPLKHPWSPRECYPITEIIIRYDTIRYDIYTVSHKKHVTTFSKITWTISARLQ